MNLDYETLLLVCPLAEVLRLAEISGPTPTPEEETSDSDRPTWTPN